MLYFYYREKTSNIYTNIIVETNNITGDRRALQVLGDGKIYACDIDVADFFIENYLSHLFGSPKDFDLSYYA